MSVRAVLVCYRGESGGFIAEFTYWESVGQARQAEVELAPCGPLCIGVHSVVNPDRKPDRRRTAGRTQRAT